MKILLPCLFFALALSYPVMRPDADTMAIVKAIREKSQHRGVVQEIDSDLPTSFDARTGNRSLTLFSLAELHSRCFEPRCLWLMLGFCCEVSNAVTMILSQGLNFGPKLRAVSVCRTGFASKAMVPSTSSFHHKTCCHVRT